ncbi:hypothetical protein J6590_019181 [Homalodisca vitripennis]|nr:hypothetical protein J6590_019181 [Homalodisca vitripennis]
MAWRGIFDAAVLLTDIALTRGTVEAGEITAVKFLRNHLAHAPLRLTKSTNLTCN